MTDSACVLENLIHNVEITGEPFRLIPSRSKFQTLKPLLFLSKKKRKEKEKKKKEESPVSHRYLPSSDVLLPVTVLSSLCQNRFIRRSRHALNPDIVDVVVVGDSCPAFQGYPEN